MTKLTRLFAPLLGLTLFAACGGGGATAGSGQFRLIEFLEAGLDNIPRNRGLTFLFSAAVTEGQDFAERLKIENIQGGPNSNFSRALGSYVVTAERVTFTPQLPQQPDRSDAGLRADGNYTVFLKAGPDALTSETGDAIAIQQEFSFDTGDFFEDPNPAEPPRAIGLVARDATAGTEIDIARLDPRPDEQGTLDNATLIANGRVLEPGAGPAPDFATPWQFDLEVSEPIDPASVNVDTIELVEIFSDATTTDDASAPGAPDDHFGNEVTFKVPVNVTVVQGVDEATGLVRSFIRVTPLFTLVDDTRYRLRFSGSILGIDFRKTFIGDNGLTGDGQTTLAGAEFPEPGGLGYTTEFIVRDRPAITRTRTLSYDPLRDAIAPEDGTTTARGVINSALYNPASDPGRAVGFLPAFGNGEDGNLSVSAGGVTVIDTGDTPNEDVGNPFSVFDLNPTNALDGSANAPGSRTFDSRQPFELRLGTLIVSTASTLQITGVNPILFRVAGVVQINGIITLAGEGGLPGGNAVATGGLGGPGGFDGGESRRVSETSCRFTASSGCATFLTYLNACQSRKNGFPYTTAGEGPGRGHPGGDAYTYPSGAGTNGSLSGTGGGGGSHATSGTAGEDRLNSDGDPGTAGDCAGFMKVPNSGLIGVRGEPGTVYGDAAVIDITVGGSGGGAGGGVHNYQTFGSGISGGGGGGGGGMISIFASGSISIPGGTIDASGGTGGRGNSFSWLNNQNNRVVSGAGGGGAGGTIVLVSGDDLQLAAAQLLATGGTGGARAPVGAGVTCLNCNAGGTGGKGFVFLMDSDGLVEGVLPGTPGTVETANSVQTVSEFEASRFDAILAVTELFNVLAADPDYLDLASTDILAFVSLGQRIRIRMTSAKGDVNAPLNPDVDTEIDPFEVALVHFDAGGVTVDITGDANNLNPAAQTPDRDAFVRVIAEFEYDNGPDAALGPFATIDEMVLSFTFN